MRRARVWRRVARMVAWLCFAAAISALAATTVVSWALFDKPTGWFWSEWGLNLWLDSPVRVLSPFMVTLALATLISEFALAFGRDPVARILGLSVVDRHGLPPNRWRFVARSIGSLVSWASLGLGFGGILVDRYGRSLADFASATLMVENR